MNYLQMETGVETPDMPTAVAAMHTIIVGALMRLMTILTLMLKYMGTLNPLMAMVMQMVTAMIMVMAMAIAMGIHMRMEVTTDMGMGMDTAMSMGAMGTAMHMMDM